MRKSDQVFEADGQRERFMEVRLLPGRTLSNAENAHEKCLAIANGTYRKRTGCTLALYRCMKDSKCREAQIDFLAKCTKLFTLTACTNQCLCSQKRLFTLPVGRPLRDCECDGSGTEELYCLGLRAHAKNMDCSWKKRRTRRRLKKKRCKRCRQRRGDRCGRRVQKKKD